LPGDPDAVRRGNFYAVGAGGIEWKGLEEMEEGALGIDRRRRVSVISRRRRETTRDGTVLDEIRRTSARCGFPRRPVCGFGEGPVKEPSPPAGKCGGSQRMGIGRPRGEEGRQWSRRNRDRGVPKMPRAAIDGAKKVRFDQNSATPLPYGHGTRGDDRRCRFPQAAGRRSGFREIQRIGSGLVDRGGVLEESA